MKLDAHLEIVNNLANGFRKNQSLYSQLSFAKDSQSNKYVLLIKNTKKPNADKFRLENNIDKIHCKFVNEGKASVILKEPNFTLIIQKANVNQLKVFLKLVHLGATSLNITDELEKLQSSTEISSKKKDSSKESDQQQLKKPTTSLIVKSKNEYSSNFKAIISQNLKIKTKIGGDKANLSETLVKLVLNNCELKNIDPSIFDLINLTHLDISSNKLSKIDNFILERLEELNLSQNEIVFIGQNCRTPRLTSLDLSFNKLTKLDKNFCLNFKTLAKLRVTNNVLHTFWSNFGYSFMSLKNFYASNNQLRFLPYSCSHLRLEMLEMHDNPFVFNQMELNLNTELKKFPTMVEICARQVLNKKIKHTPRDIPRTLCEYIGTNTKCICGMACFEYNFKTSVKFDLTRIAKSFTYLTINGVSDNEIPLEMSLCSLKCLRKNCKIKLNV